MRILLITIAFLSVVVDTLALATTEQGIISARAEVARTPQRADLHVTLAELLAKRGRETADHDFYKQSLTAAEDALTIEPNHIGASRAKIWALLGQHEFLKAKQMASKLNKRVPDDLLTYALLVDADIELGNYAAAEEAAQWLLDMRPGGLAGLTRAAYLRELYGDLEGSILLLTQAIESSPGTDPEQHAWLMVHLAHLHLQLGRIEVAEQILQQANQAFPSYHYALRHLINVSLAKDEIPRALKYAERFYRAAPHPENLYVLASILERSGNVRLASEAFSSFERQALAESSGWDNANRELVAYLVDVAANPRRGLEVAEAEFSRRQDIFTKDAYAWALLGTGDAEQAWQVISQVLSIGSRSPQILFHAGVIAARCGHKAEAENHLRQALAIEPWNRLAPEAKKLLTVLEKVNETKQL